MTNRIDYFFTQRNTRTPLKGQPIPINREERIYGPELFGLQSNAEAYGREEIYFLNVSQELVKDILFVRDISSLLGQGKIVHLDCGLFSNTPDNRSSFLALKNGFLNRRNLVAPSSRIFLPALKIMPNGDFNFGEHDLGSDFKGRIWNASNKRVDMTTFAYVKKSHLDGTNHLYIKLACGEAPDRVAPEYRIGESFLANSNVTEGNVADYPTIVLGDYNDMGKLGAAIYKRTEKMPIGEKLELVNEEGFNIQSGPTFTKLANGHIGVELTEKNGLQERTVIDEQLPAIIHGILTNIPNSGGEKEVKITSASRFVLGEDIHERLSTSRMPNGDIKIALYESGNNAELQEILVELAREVLQTGKQVHIKLFKERIDGNYRLWDVQGARSAIARKIAKQINDLTPITDGRSVETRASNYSLIVRIKPKKVVDEAQRQRDEDAISKLIYDWEGSGFFNPAENFENILNRHEALTIYNKENSNGHIAVEKRLGEIVFTIPNSAGALEENVLLAVTDLANNLTNDNAITLYGGDNGERITLTKVNNSIQISMTDITSPIQNKRFFELVEKFLKSNSSIDFNTNGLDTSSDEFSNFLWALGEHLESAFGQNLGYTKNGNIINIKKINRAKVESKFSDVSEISCNSLLASVYKNGHVELNIGDYKLDIKKTRKVDTILVELDDLDPTYRDVIGTVINEIINFGIKVQVSSPDRDETVKLHQKRDVSNEIVIEVDSNNPIATLKYIAPFFLLQGKTIELVTSKNDVDTEKRVDTVLDITTSLTQPLAKEGKTVQITPIQNAPGSDPHYRLKAITAQK